ncbi:MAG: carboxypeptidase regulatory-like domain-containing protein [Acidobacteriota bacterium]
MISIRNIAAIVAALAALVLTPAFAGEIVGTVKYAGTAPKPAPIRITKDKAVCAKTPQYDESLVVSADGGVKNTVVKLADPPEGAQMPVRSENPKLDQRGCKFVPRVQIVPAGQQMDILNSDGILHNIHTYPKNNAPINKAQPKFRKVMKQTFEKPDLVRVTCDVHNWMTGYVIVAGHPYYALTDESGSFRIEDVPQGTYTIEYWHEKLGKKTAQVTVPAAGSVSADLEYPAVD